MIKNSPQIGRPKKKSPRGRPPTPKSRGRPLKVKRKRRKPTQPKQLEVPVNLSDGTGKLIEISVEFILRFFK